jgi:hypothetical protein
MRTIKINHPEINEISEKSNKVCSFLFHAWRMVFVSVCLLVLCPGIGAQETLTEGDIAIAVVFERGPDEARLGLDGIFMDSLEIELELAGFRISNTAEPAILIRVAYILKETLLEFNLSAEVLADGRMLYANSYSGELSFELDMILLDHARDIAGLITEYVDSAMPDTKEEVAGDSADMTETSVDEDPAVESVEEPETAVDEEIALESVKETMPASEENLVDEISKDNIQEHYPLYEKESLIPDWLVLEADAGVFLAGGEPGRFFKGGYTVSTLVGYRFPYNPGIVMGGSLGCMYFMLDGYSAEARGLAVLLGPGLRLESKDSNDFVPGLAVNAGAALLVVFPESGGSMAKIVPAAEAAMTVGLVLENFRLYARMGAKVLFEGSMILYGFAPAIGIQF